MLLSAWIGIRFRRRRSKIDDDVRQNLDLIITAVLTLLALIIGFSFLMAVSRYDQRKNYEQAEANSIGTEYVRADLLPAADGARVRTLLRDYLDQRVLFYQTRDQRELQQTNTHTAQLQTELWYAVDALPPAQRTPVAALAVSGMNDVLNSRGYTQAAWWNRITWGLGYLWQQWLSAPICWSAMECAARNRESFALWFCRSSYASRSFS
jgi:hypothetical protein